MGLFDTVKVRCPECGNPDVEFQSKAEKYNV